MANQYINGMTALWNSAGTTYSAIKMNVTNAASSATSMLLQLQTGSVDRFIVDKGGNVTAAGTVTTAGLISSAVMRPSSNDSAALGVSGTAWSDLFLASGGVINWSASDVTITHAANALAFAGASLGYSFDAVVKPAVNDGSALGSTTLQWSDLFLATGSVLNFANGDVTITHGSDVLTVDGGDLRVSTAGSNSASVVTVGGAQTLTGKTLTSPTLDSATLSNPTINNATLTGTFSGGTFTSSTLTSPTISSPTISGTTTASSLSAATITTSGAITAGTDITSLSGTFIGIASQAILAASSTGGAIYLRPQGAAVSTNQTSIDSNGNVVIAGRMTAEEMVVSNGGAVMSYSAVSGDQPTVAMWSGHRGWATGIWLRTDNWTGMGRVDGNGNPIATYAWFADGQFSVNGNFNASSNIGAGGAVYSGQNFQSNGTNAVVACNGGSIFFRPHGAGNGTQDARYGTDGLFLNAGVLRIVGDGNGTTIVLNNGHSSYQRYGDGMFFVTAGAAKPGGGSWLNSSSDARVKDVIEEYTYGLDEIEQLRPVRYRYKGNNAAPGEKSLIEGMEFVGFLAQDVERVFPRWVKKNKGYIDGIEVDDYRSLDTDELIFALLNAVKRLNGRIKELEKRP